MNYATAKELMKNDSKSHLGRLRGFTLIELLVVIAVIALLAAMIFPITGAVNRAKIRSKARTELTEMENMIQGYKDKLGHYPPGNPTNAMLTALYYELSGAIFNPANNTYQTLDKNSTITVAELKSVFNVDGIVNSMQGDGGDEGRPAQRFTTGLKPPQVVPLDANAPNGPKLLVSAVGWKNINEPLNPKNPSSNPIFYNASSPTNNPNSFDLWVDVVIGTKTNRISNWSREPFIP